MMAFDVVQRWLEGQRPAPSTYVRNITDIDDKIIQAVQLESGEPMHVFASSPHEMR